MLLCGWLLGSFLFIAYSATARSVPARGTARDTAYTEQFHTALAVAAYLNGAIPVEERLASFAAVPRLIHVAGTLDSLARQWPVACNDITVFGDTRGPMNILCVNTCNDASPPIGQLILYFEPENVSATVVRMEIAPMGSSNHREPSTMPALSYSSGQSSHTERVLFLNTAVGLARSWYGIDRR
jgi:hypothetical protein